MLRLPTVLAFCLPLLFHLSATTLAADERPDPVDETTSDPPEQESYTVEPVVVRAPRESRDLSRDRAAAGSVLLPADLDDAGDTLPAVLDQQAGVRVTRLGGPASSATLSVRGSTSDQVLVVLDGVPLNVAAGGPVDLSQVPVGHVERVEVYRGMAPLAFGSSAIGGAVSITTRRARARELRLSAGAGSFLAREAGLWFAEPHDRWDLAVGLDYRGWEGGFGYTSDNGTRFDGSDDHPAVRRNNGYDQVNLLLDAHLRPAPAVSVGLLEWFFWRAQGVPGVGQFETSRSRYALLDSLSVLSLEGRGLAERVDIDLHLALRATRSRFDDPLGEVGLAADDDRSGSLAPSLGSLLRIALMDTWDVTLRAGYRHERNDQGGPASWRHILDGGIESGLHLPGADLLLLPTLRIEYQQSSLSPGLAPAGTAADGQNAGRIEWSGRLALVNTTIPDVRLHLSGGRAVRLPSLFELFGSTGRMTGNPLLKSESSLGVDGGAVYDCTRLPTDYRLRVEVHGFFSDVYDLIQFVQTAQNVARAENIDRARLWGVEAGLRGDLFSHLRLQANYTWLQARNTGRAAARRGNELPLRPSSSWFGRAEGYTGWPGGPDELSLYLEAEWLGPNHLDHANLVRLPSRFYLNAGLGLVLPGDRARLGIGLDNLTDERSSDLAGYPLPGRSLHVTLNAGLW